MLLFKLEITTDNPAEFARISALLAGTANVSTVAVSTPVHQPVPPIVATTAPATPVVAPAAEPAESVNANAPAFDVTGMPWDERIHAGGKTINSDGSWRKRRGVDENAVRAIEAERRVNPATLVAPTAPATPAAPVATSDPFAGQPVPVAAAVASDPFGAPLTVPNAAPLTPPTTVAQSVAPVPAANAAGWTFAALMKYVADSMKTGVIKPEDIKALTDYLGIANIAVLASDPVKFTDAINYWVVLGKMTPTPTA